MLQVATGSSPYPRNRPGLLLTCIKIEVPYALARHSLSLLHRSLCDFLCTASIGIACSWAPVAMPVLFVAASIAIHTSIVTANARPRAFSSLASCPISSCLHQPGTSTMHHRSVPQKPLTRIISPHGPSVSGLINAPRSMVHERTCNPSLHHLSPP